MTLWRPGMIGRRARQGQPRLGSPGRSRPGRRPGSRPPGLRPGAGLRALDRGRDALLPTAVRAPSRPWCLRRLGRLSGLGCLRALGAFAVLGALAVFGDFAARPRCGGGRGLGRRVAASPSGPSARWPPCGPRLGGPGRRRRGPLVVAFVRPRSARPARRRPARASAASGSATASAPASTTGSLRRRLIRRSAAGTRPSARAPARAGRRSAPGMPAGPAPPGSRAGRRLEEQDRAGDRRVQRPDDAAHRDPHEQVAATADRRAEPLPLAPDDDRDRAAQVGLAGRQRGVRLGPDDPQPADVQVGQRARQVVDGRQQQVLDGAGRGLDRRRGQRRLAMGREDDAVDARGLGAAQQRPDVLRVLERVEHEHERPARRARSPGRGSRRRRRTGAARRRGRCPGGRRSRPARSSEPPSTSTIGIRRLVAWRTSFSSA